MCPKIVVFAFNVRFLVKISGTLPASETLLGLGGQVLERSLALAIILLSIEQLVASVMIAPKHRKSFSVHSPNNAMFGVELYLGGIGVQFLVMVYTLALTIALHKKITDRDTRGRQRITVLTILMFSLVSLLARTIYRLIELSSFSTGYLLFLAHSEVYFYACDCSPVLIALGIWLVARIDDLSTDYLPDNCYNYQELHVRPEGPYLP